MQSKLNHSVAAQDVLKKFVCDENIAVVIVSEPHMVRFNGWQYDSISGAAIAVYRPGLWLSDIEVSDGFVAVTVEGLFCLYSCYARPSLAEPDFERLLNSIELSVMTYQGRCNTVIVAGDFNAHSSVWDDRCMDNRGVSSGTLGDSLGLMVSNTGEVPTFFGKSRGSMIDITIVSESFAERLLEWRVLPDHGNMIDHYSITCSLSLLLLLCVL